MYCWKSGARGGEREQKESGNRGQGKESVNRREVKHWGRTYWWKSGAGEREREQKESETLGEEVLVEIGGRVRWMVE